MRQVLLDIDAKKLKKIENDNQLLKTTILDKLNIDNLRKSIKNAHMKGSDKVHVLTLQFTSSCAFHFECNHRTDHRTDHNTDTCEFMKFVESTIMSKLDLNEFNIKIKFIGEHIVCFNAGCFGIQYEWKIYLIFGL
jgi:hypothetical protein